MSVGGNLFSVFSTDSSRGAPCREDLGVRHTRALLRERLKNGFSFWILSSD